MSAASIKRNIAANFAGSAWIGLMGLAFVPFYIRLMGTESYGVVGVYASLQAMFAVLDLGLSQTLTREMALLSGDPKNANRMADTVRTLEIVYWAVALAVAGTILLTAHFLAYQWLNPEQLSRKSLLEALWVMALVIGLRWPVMLYLGGLNGLQRQVSVNIILAGFATLQGLGALVVLWLIEPTVRTFFLWQALIALLQVVVLRIALGRCLPSASSGIFHKEILKEIWHFAAGMSGISVAATILTQLDKVLLSKMLTLTEFGYYTFAATVAAALYRVVGPVFTAYYPRLTELLTKKDQLGLVKTYHQGCQLMAVVVLPSALTLVFFSKEVLELWTGDSGVVANSTLLVSLLVIGNAAHGLMHLPYALQLAHGWTKLALYTNIVAVIILVPAIYFSALHWGGIGAAGVWIILNCGYLFITIQIMHRRLLRKEKWHWYVNDVAKILVAVLIVNAVGRLIMSSSFEVAAKVATLIFVLGMSTVVSIVSAESLRTKLRLWRGFKFS